MSAIAFDKTPFIPPISTTQQKSTVHSNKVTDVLLTASFLQTAFAGLALYFTSPFVTLNSDNWIFSKIGARSLTLVGMPLATLATASQLQGIIRHHQPSYHLYFNVVHSAVNLLFGIVVAAELSPMSCAHIDKEKVIDLTKCEELASAGSITGIMLTLFYLPFLITQICLARFYSRTEAQTSV